MTWMFKKRAVHNHVSTDDDCNDKCIVLEDDITLSLPVLEVVVNICYYSWQKMLLSKCVSFGRASAWVLIELKAICV